MNDGDDAQAEQGLVVGEAIVAPVGEQCAWLHPGWAPRTLRVTMGRWGESFSLAGVMVKASGTRGWRRKPGASCTRNPIRCDRPWSGTVLDAPSGIGIADHFAIGVGVGEKQGGVHGQDHAEGRERLVLPASRCFTAGTSHRSSSVASTKHCSTSGWVVGQAGDKPAQGAFARHIVVQATDFSELPAAAQPLQLWLL